jgi:bacterial/archaeal transporter family-2 protein
MMKGVGFAVLVALVCGGALACQVGVNAALRRKMDDTILTSVASFAVGLVGLVLIALLRRNAPPTLSTMACWPKWVWLGGLLGAFYIAAAATLAPRVGGAGWLAAVIAGQIITALILDHYGWLGFERRPLGVSRVLGASLLMVGVLLVLRR